MMVVAWLEAVSARPTDVENKMNFFVVFMDFFIVNEPKTTVQDKTKM